MTDAGHAAPLDSSSGAVPVRGHRLSSCSVDGEKVLVKFDSGRTVAVFTDGHVLVKEGTGMIAALGAEVGSDFVVIFDASEQVADDVEPQTISLSEVSVFWEEFADRFTWDLLPFSYLYGLFNSWLEVNGLTGEPIGFYKFNAALAETVQADVDGDWECPDKDQRHRPGTMMDVAEPLTVEYNLEGWINHEAKKSDREARATMTPEMLKQKYRGLRRKTRR